MRNQKGESVLDIKGIPAEQVGMLVEALSAELPSQQGLQPSVVNGR